MKSLPTVIAIGGPTASGKSRLARLIARSFDGEIISADSRQIYRELTIGTAKDPIEEHLQNNVAIIEHIPHHLIDFLSPTDDYNLASFQNDAHKAIEIVHARGKLPILVGGTGLYLDAVAYNYSLTKEKEHHSRAVLQNTPVDELQKILKQENNGTFEILTESDSKNPHRLIRAIERSRTSAPFPSKNDPKYNLLYLVISVEKEALQERITDRVRAMFEKGLTAENKVLRDKGFSTLLPAMKTIGYQEFDSYFAGTQTLEETESLIIRHTLQYAKRQMTWFRRNKEAIFVSSEDEAIEAVRKFLSDDRS